MTCCLKNAIGIIGEKNCIPHHTLGTPETDGDAYPFVNAKTTTDKKIRGIAMDILRKDIPVVGYLIAFAKKIVTPFVGKPLEVVRNGHWYGSDTVWGAILDLNKILVYLSLIHIYTFCEWIVEIISYYFANKENSQILNGDVLIHI